MRTTVSTAIESKITPRSNKIVGYWLGGMAGMVTGAIFLGGVTRLTESGLSMVDWHPFKELPPLSNKEWIKKFEVYKQFPEYEYNIKTKGDFNLQDFQRIWWMEYLHRVWGRLVGTTFVLPAAYFYMKGYLSPSMKKKILFLGSLIGFQGVLGWYMVRSGLQKPYCENEPSDIPRVSHFRLCAHLSSATLLYALFFWNSMNHLYDYSGLKKFDGMKKLKILGHSSKGVFLATFIYGAFVAGMDAGLVYNSWPLMGNSIVPTDLIVEKYRGVVSNLVYNPSAIQFVHRMLAYSTAGAVSLLWLATMKSAAPSIIRFAANAVVGATALQIFLGITALVNYVPVYLGSAHQMSSIVLLSTLLYYTNLLKHVPK